MLTNEWTALVVNAGAGLAVIVGTATWLTLWRRRRTQAQETNELVERRLDECRMMLDETTTQASGGARMNERLEKQAQQELARRREQGRENVRRFRARQKMRKTTRKKTTHDA